MSKNRKSIIIIATLIICFLLTFLVYNLNNPTRVNKLFASVLNSTPANSAFDDENFYELVVDAYNNQTGLNEPYTYSLTDSELASITTISKYISDEDNSITSLKGIEKLTGLQTLTIFENNISTVDLSNNLSLTELNLYGNNISEIDLSHNQNLITLALANNNISEIDLSHNINLEYLFLNDNNITELNISNNTNLIGLHLYNNNLSEIDLSHNLNLTNLNLDGNSLAELDLSNNQRLTDLSLNDNNIIELDLSDNSNLINISVNSNNLTNLLFGSKPYLQYLNLGNNNLTELDLSDFSNIYYLDLMNNKLSNLALSDNTIFSYLYLENNDLSELILSNNEVIQELTLSGNELRKLDLSGSTRLPEVNNLYQNCYIKKDESYPLIDIKLPVNYDITNYTVKKSNIISIEDNMIKGLDSGSSQIYLNYVDPDGNSSTVLVGTAYVYDIISSKYSFNDELGIVNVGPDDNEEILNNISVTSIRTYRIIEDGILKICSSSKKCQKVYKEYKLIKYYSNNYDISNGYILDSDNNFDISDIIIDSLDVFATLNNGVVQISYNNSIIGEIPVISYSSSKYDLTNDYIYIANDIFNLNDVEVVNCDKRVENNNFIITSNEIEILNIPIIRYETNYEVINGYIYLGTDNFDSARLSVINGYISEYDDFISIYDNNNNYIKSIYLVKVTSSEYDFSKDYIYLGNTNYYTGYVKISNGNIVENNDKLQIYDNNGYLHEEKNLVKLKANYEISDIDGYINTGFESFDINKITTINCTLEVSSSNIYIIYNGQMIKSYNIVSILVPNKYFLNKDYLYSKNEQFEINQVIAIGCEKYVDDNNNFVVKYSENGKTILSVPIITYQTDYEVVDGYIYLGTDNFDSSKLNVTNGYFIVDEFAISIYNNVDTLVDSIYLVKLSSNMYDLSKDYIYLKEDTFDPDLISFGFGRGAINDNKLQIYDINGYLHDEKDLVRFTSDYYDINDDNNYINTGYEAFDINKVNTVNCTIEVYDTYVNLVHDNSVVKAFDLISIISPNKYDLSQDYIYVRNEEFEINQIRAINCDKLIESNYLVIKHNEDEILRKPIIRITSNKYNLAGDYVYSNYKFNDYYIKVSNGYTSHDGHRIYIHKIDQTIIDSIQLFEVYSDMYDLANDYINVGNASINMEYIYKSDDVILSVDNNKLQIKSTEEVFEEKTIISYSSTKYDLTGRYIYIGNSTFDLDLVNAINCDKKVENNNLVITYREEELLNIPIIRYETDYEIIDGYIYLGTNGFDSSRLSIVNGSIHYFDGSIELFSNNNNFLETIFFVNISSDTYDLSKEYIYLGASNFNKDNMVVNNGTTKENNNKLEIYDNNGYLHEVKELLGIMTNYYTIDDNNSYINTGYEAFDINKLYMINCTIEVYDTYINVMYGNEIIKTYNLISILSPNKYDLTLDYIYTRNNLFEVNQIRTINCEKYVDDNNDFVVTYNGSEILRKPIITLSSSIYNLNKDYIYVSNKKFSNSDISVTNGYISYDDSKIYVYDSGNGNILDSIVLLSISSLYDLNKDYIYLGLDKFNIDKVEVNGCNKQVNDDILRITYNNEVLEEKKLVGISSNIYNLENNYIYTGTNEFVIEYIEGMNAELNVNDNNVLEIRYGKNILEEKQIVSILSDKYDLSNKYIYLGVDNLNDSYISCINCSIQETDNNIQLVHDGKVLHSIPEVKISSSKYDLSKDTIRIEDNFDENYIFVINGSVEYKNNKLYIIAGDKIVKEYDVEEIVKPTTKSTTQSTSKTTSKVTTKSSSKATTKSTTQSTSKTTKKSNTVASKITTKKTTKNSTVTSTKKTTSNNSTSKLLYTTTVTNKLNTTTIRNKEEKDYVSSLMKVVIAGVVSIIIFIILLVFINKNKDEKKT